jgi:integrase
VPLYQRPGSDVWYIDIRRPGRARIRRSTRTSDRVAAQRQHDELAARVWQQKQAGKQFTDALAAWLTARARSRQELSALKQIRAAYKDRPLHDVTGASFADAFGHMAPATYNRIANIARAALNIAHVRGWIEQAPKIARRKPPRHGFRWLTADEWKRLRAELPDHLKPMADFALATGLRWSNVAGLTWERVDVRRKLAWIEAHQAKGRRAIAVPLSAAALAALRRVQGERTGFVFTYAGHALQSPKTAWRAAIKRAKIRPVRWHDLRHTWASWHVMNGTPPGVLKELGGWSSLEQVQIYAHLAPSHVAQYAGNASPVGHKGGHSGAKRTA